MPTKSWLLFTLACLIYRNEAISAFKVLPETQLILQKFLNLVESNQLNVSIVTSHTQYWFNGEVKQVADTALLLPLNNVVLTEHHLTTEDGEQWLSDLSSFTSQGNAIATHRVISFEDGEISDRSENSTNLDGVPMSESFQNILRPLQTDDNGFVKESGDYEIMYNYDVQGEDNTKLNTKMYTVNLNVQIKDYSEHMSETQMKRMKPILSKIWIMMDGDIDLVNKYLVEAINDQIPLRYTSWEVLTNPGSFYVPNARWVKFRIYETYYVIYALDL